MDLQRFSPTRRAETRAALGLRGPVLLYVGWLIPRKRLDLVLAATAAHTQVTTLIVGTGPDAGRLEKQTQALNIADRVYFLGAKKPAELAPLYSAADVLLLPSDREGWANVLLEAMACGTPVVTRDVGAGADLVTSDTAGRIAAAGTADAVADAVGKILRDPPRREDTRRFAEGFGWEETSAGQWNIFQGLVDCHDRCA
nr:glycosyltransferase [Eilatimonas milleporae]